jgi:autotransporter translocation and assembly factor TamB
MSMNQASAKRLKGWKVIIPVSVATLAILAVLLVSLYLPGRIRREIEQSLNGSFSSQRISVLLNEMVIESPIVKSSNGSDFFSAKRLVVRYSPLSLLISRNSLSALKGIEISEPSVNLVRDRRGSWNHAGLFKKAKAPLALEAMKASMSVTGGTVRVRDVGTGFSRVFTAVRLRVAPGRSRPYELAMTAVDDKDRSCRYEIAGSLDLSKPRLEAVIDGASVDIAAWTSMLPKSDWKVKGGRADIRLTLRGRADSLSGLEKSLFLTGSSTVRDGVLVYGPIKLAFDHIGGMIMLTGESMEFRGLKGLCEGAAVSVSGDLTGPGDPLLDLSVDVESLDVKRIKSLRSHLPLDGVVSFHGRVLGMAKDVTVTGRCIVPGGTVNGMAVKNAMVEGTYTSAGIQIKKLVSNVNGGEIEGYGWLFPEEKTMLFSLKGKGSPLDESLKSVGKVSGTADFNVSIFGGFAKPLVMGQTVVGALTVGRERFSRGGARFLYQNDTLFLTQGAIERGGGLLNATGLVDLKSEKLDLLMKASKFPIGGVAVPKVGALNGDVSGTAKLCGSFSTPSAYGFLGSPRVTMSSSGSSTVLEDLKLPFEWSGAVLSVPAGSARWGNMPVSVKGSVATDSTSFMSMSVRMPDLNISSLMSHIPGAPPLAVRGRGGLALCLVGNPELGLLWRGAGNLEKGAVTTSGWLLPSGDMNWLSCLSMSNVPVGSMVNMKSSRGALKGVLDEGDLLLRGHGDTLQMGVNLSFLGGSVLGFPVSSFCGDMTLRGKNLSIADADLSGARGRLSLSGNVDSAKGNFDLSTLGSALDFEYLLSHMDTGTLGMSYPEELRREWTSIQGIGEVKGRLSGSLAMPCFNGLVGLREGVLHNEALAFRSRVDSNPDFSRFDDFFLKIGRSTYEGRGKITYRPRLAYDLSLKADRGDISRIIAFTPWKDMALKGELSGDFSLKGEPGRLLLDGTMELGNAVLLGQPVDSVKAVIRSQSDNVYFENLEVALPEGVIKGSGTVSKSGALAFHFTSTALPLSELTVLSPYLGKASGTVNMAMDIGGTKLSPEMTADFTADDVSFHNQKFGHGEGKFTLKKGVIDIESLSLINGDEKYRLSGHISFPGGKVPLMKDEWRASATAPRLDISGEVANGNLTTIFHFISDTLKKEMVGSVDGTFALSGTLADPAFSVDCALREGRIREVPLKKAVVRMNYGAGTLHIDDLVMMTKDGSVHLAGDVNGKDGNSIALEMQNMDLRVLSTLYPMKFPLGGIIDLKAKISGMMQFPDIASEIKVKNGFIGGFDFEGLQGRIEADKGVVSLKDCYIIERGSKVSLRGSIPLMVQDKKLVSTAPMEIKADLKEDDLDLLSLMIPMDGKTSGSLNGKLGIFGVFPDLVMDGKVMIKDGEFQPAFLKKPVTGFAALVRCANEKIDIKKLEGRLGSGTFTVGGEIDLSKLSFAFGDLTIKGKDLAISAKKYFNGIADIDATLKREGDSQVLLGSIKARNSTIHIPTEDLMRDPEENAKFIKSLKESVPPQLRSILVKVGLTLDDDTWLTFLTSSFLTRGSLSVMGRMPDLALVGEVDLFRGTLNLPFLETPFKVYQGKAYFDGEGWSPYLAVDAQTTVGKHIVYMDLEGKMDNPKVNLTSEPPMQQDAIEKMLAGSVYSSFVPAGALSADAMTTRLAERVLDLNIVQPLFHAIGKTFALSDVSLEYTYEGNWSVKLAKALDRREQMLVTYESLKGQYGELHRLFGLEYRFKKGMLVRVSQDETGKSYFWLQTRHPFNWGN